MLIVAQEGTPLIQHQFIILITDSLFLIILYNSVFFFFITAQPSGESQNKTFELK